MYKRENIIRKKGSARLSVVVFLLSAGILQAGIQGVSASEADFFTEEVILSGEEETPQTEQEHPQEEQAIENPQHGQNIQSEQDARSGQNIQSEQDARSGQNIQSGQNVGDAQTSTNLPDKAGSRKSGQQFYTPNGAKQDTLQTQEAAGAQNAGGAVRGQTQTERSETGQSAQQTQEEQSKAEQPVQQIRLQADTQTRENWEDMLFWGMLFVAVGLFLAGTYRLWANTFMRW